MDERCGKQQAAALLVIQLKIQLGPFQDPFSSNSMAGRFCHFGAKDLPRNSLKVIPDCLQLPPPDHRLSRRYQFHRIGDFRIAGTDSSENAARTASTLLLFPRRLTAA